MSQVVEPTNKFADFGRGSQTKKRKVRAIVPIQVQRTSSSFFHNLSPSPFQLAFLLSLFSPADRHRTERLLRPSSYDLSEVAPEAAAAAEAKEEMKACEVMSWWSL